MEDKSFDVGGWIDRGLELGNTIIDWLQGKEEQQRAQESNAMLKKIGIGLAVAFVISKVL